MATKISIEQMKSEDIEHVLEIQSEVGIGPWSADGYSAELRNPESICLIAKVDGKTVGFLVARLITNENWIELYNLAVTPVLQRSSIGQTLLQSLLTEASQRNFSRILLEVRVGNHKAITFYHKNAFTAIGIRKHYFTNPVENALQLERKLH